MNTGLIAQAATTIDAPPAQVWDALTNPAIIQRYMFGTQAVSDWQEGSSIVWKGEWQGKAYEDKGTILKMEANRLLQYSHFSPLSGQPDEPENYHIVTIELSGTADGTRVTLSQDRNATEAEREHAQQNWAMMLDGLKKEVEQ